MEEACPCCVVFISFNRDSLSACWVGIGFLIRCSRAWRIELEFACTWLKYSCKLLYHKVKFFMVCISQGSLEKQNRETDRKNERSLWKKIASHDYRGRGKGTMGERGLVIWPGRQWKRMTHFLPSFPLGLGPFLPTLDWRLQAGLGVRCLNQSSLRLPTKDSMEKELLFQGSLMPRKSAWVGVPHQQGLRGLPSVP